MVCGGGTDLALAGWLLMRLKVAASLLMTWVMLVNGRPGDRLQSHGLPLTSRRVDDLRAQMAQMAPAQREPDDEARFTHSPAMRAIKHVIDNVAGTDVTVLAWGESGVGKETIPRLLHRLSSRRNGPFVKVNCAALPFELLESELFGYERGAFTGAHRRKPGKFELADKGTIFLDEIGELPWPLQAKLLHVLQDGEFSRLGSEQSVRVDARVVTATNKHLARLVEERTFRADLYYRLNVVNIHVPPLRERREEIPILVDEFLHHFAGLYGRRRPEVSAAAMRRFMEYGWPGNIRELENVIKRIVVLRTEDWVFEDLVTTASTDRSQPSPPVPPPDEDERLGLREIGRRAASAAERAALVRMLERVGWNRTEAARRLRINYKTMLHKIEEYGVAGPSRRRSA
jgi:two-component system, NtrC family, response regulator AtoC